MPKSRGRRKRRPRKLSIMVLHRTRDARDLLAAIERQAPACATEMGKRYAPYLADGQTLPDYRLAFDLIGGELRARITRLAELDERLDDAEVEQIRLIDERADLIAGELYPRAVAVRRSIELTLGREAGRSLHGIKGRTARKPPGLARQLQHTLRRLKDPKRELPAPKHGFPTADRKTWIHQLDELHRKLLALNQAIVENQAAVTGLVIHKKRALDAFDAAYHDALRFLQTCYRMAGFDARLLKNLRPYYRRRRLAREARQRRAVRAAQVEGQPAPAKAPAARKETARVTVPRAIARWLEKSRQYA